MQTIDHTTYEALIADARVLSRDGYGDKVFELADGRIVKLFRRKRLISSTVINPYARRFDRATRRLRTRDIPTVDVIGLYRIPSVRRDAVVYRKMAGSPLRDALRQADEPGRLIARMSAFLSALHDRGVYLRAIHFGNVIVRPDDTFGLIDVSESSFSFAPLSPRRRARNFRHLVRYQEDRQAVHRFGVEPFLHKYLSPSSLTSEGQRRFIRFVGAVHPMFRHLPNVMPEGVQPRATLAASTTR